MMLYLLAGVIGFIIAKLFAPTKVTSPFFNEVVMNNIKAGKRVAICVDNEATIFEMKEKRIMITRGASDFFKEPVDTGPSLDEMLTELTDKQ